MDSIIHNVVKVNGYAFKVDSSVQIILSPSEKGSTLKGRNLLPFGSKFFPFREDTFPEGA